MTYKSREGMVEEFHEAFGHPTSVPFSEDQLYLRDRLLYEEQVELREEVLNALSELQLLGAVSAKTRTNLLKEMADVQYVLSGLAVTFGLPLEEAFTRVHQSNMSKLGEYGQPIYRDDGKVLKGPNYQPPYLGDLID